MDEAEVRQVLRDALAPYRGRSHAELCELMKRDGGDEIQRTGPSGAHYRVEINAYWDGRKGGNVRVSASSENKKLWLGLGWTLLSEDFIMTPRGRFVGE